MMHLTIPTSWYVATMFENIGLKALYIGVLCWLTTVCSGCVDKVVRLIGSTGGIHFDLDRAGGVIEGGYFDDGSGRSYSIEGFEMGLSYERRIAHIGDVGDGTDDIAKVGVDVVERFVDDGQCILGLHIGIAILDVGCLSGSSGYVYVLADPDSSRVAVDVLKRVIG